jgi:hypothetical protein
MECACHPKKVSGSEERDSGSPAAGPELDIRKEVR